MKRNNIELADLAERVTAFFRLNDKVKVWLKEVPKHEPIANAFLCRTKGSMGLTDCKGNHQVHTLRQEDQMSKLRFISMGVTAVIGAFLTPQSARSQMPDEILRVGTFDSRCVAVAYGRSARFAEYMNGLRSELKKVKEEGNETRVKEIERLGPASQVIMHQQVFSTGSIGNIMDQIKTSLPVIAQKKGVRLVVSKWEVFHHGGPVELIDITDELVSLFSPDAQTLKIVEEMKKIDPVPMDQVSTDSRD